MRANIVSDLGRAPNAVIGDVMLDRFIYGDTNRVSPEAPIPVLQVDRAVEMLGQRRRCGGKQRLT